MSTKEGVEIGRAHPMSVSPESKESLAEALTGKNVEPQCTKNMLEGTKVDTKTDRHHEPDCNGRSRRGSGIWMDDLLSESEEAAIVGYAGQKDTIAMKRMSRAFLQVFANRTVHGKAYLMLYIVLLTATIADVVLGVLYVTANKEELEVASLALMGAVNIMILAEVALRLLAQGIQKFLMRCSNRVDLVVLVLGFLVFLLFLIGVDHRVVTQPALGDDVAEAVDSLLLFGRTVYMLIRLYALWSVRQGDPVFTFGKSSAHDVDFTTLERNESSGGHDIWLDPHIDPDIAEEEYHVL